MKIQWLPLMAFLLMACGQENENNSIALAPLSSNNLECGTMNPEACEAFALVNSQRAQAGLSPLTINLSCVDAAQFHAEDMAENNYFSHDGLNESWSDRFSRFGVSGVRGENIAIASSANTAVLNWMNSDGHRANILSDRYTSAGMGYFNRHWVQCFSNR